MSTNNVQTAMTTHPESGVAGELYDAAELCDIISKVAQEDIPFGAFVKVTGDGCELPDTSGEVTGAGRGLALKDDTKATSVGYKQGDMVSVLVKGRAYGITEEAVTAYTTPYVRYSAGTGTQQGAFRATDDATHDAQPTNVEFHTTTTAAGVAVIAFK
jgi:hypothetical protein